MYIIVHLIRFSKSTQVSIFIATLNYLIFFGLFVSEISKKMFFIEHLEFIFVFVIILIWTRRFEIVEIITKRCNKSRKYQKSHHHRSISINNPIEYSL